MNETELELILARALSDTTFRQSLLSNPQQALSGSGYLLSSEELMVLQEALRSEAPTEAGEAQAVEQRKSSWVINTLGGGNPAI